MPDNRQHPRKAIECEVGFEAVTAEGPSPRVGPRVDGRCQDMSLGGMFIETASPLAYGAALRVLVRLPGLKSEVSIDAVVRWAKPSGMGVQFGVMGARETHALTLLLSAR